MGSRHRAISAGIVIARFEGHNHLMLSTTTIPSPCFAFPTSFGLIISLHLLCILFISHVTPTSLNVDIVCVAYPI